MVRESAALLVAPACVAILGRTLRAAAVISALAGVVGATPPDQEYAPAGISGDELFERIGQAENRTSSGAYYAVARSESNKGDVFIWEMSWSGDDYRTTVRQAGFTISFGEYHGRQWYQNANGLVLSSPNFNQEDDPFAVVLNRTEASAATSSLLGVTKDTTVPEYVIVVTPTMNFEQRRYYDAKTYLPSRVEATDYSGRKTVWIYGAYSHTAGTTFPSAIDEVTDGAVALHTTLVSFARVSAGSLDLSIPLSKPLFDLSGREAVEIPARFTDEGIIVPTVIDGRGIDLFLDSGASDLVIDKSVARELALSVSGQEGMTFVSDYAGANVRVPNVSIAGLTARDVAFSTAGFHLGFRNLPGYRIVGLLGCDFVASGALEVNFEKRQLTLFRTLPSGLAAQGWSTLPLTLVDGVPVVKAVYSGRPGRFVVDLGGFYSVLFPHYFSQFPIKVPKGTGDQGYVVGLSLGRSGVKYFTMNTLILGDYVFGGVQVLVPSSTSAQQPQFDGLIGRNALSGLNLIFDYKDGELWFKPIDVDSK